MVMPAYRELSDFLNSQQAKSPNQIGVWQFKDGEAYYAQSLRRQTTTESTANEIHELGKQHDVECRLGRTVRRTGLPPWSVRPVMSPTRRSGL